jgi:hypothetical protein
VASLATSKEREEQKRKLRLVYLHQRKLTWNSAASSSIAAFWLDTVPVTTDSNTPPCPTGHYTMYLNQSEQVEQCVANGELSAANTWDCMDIAALGVSVFYSEENQSYNAVFDDYSLRPTLFRYGPQPPDFNSSQFQLNPVKDKDDGEWGVAMFFGTLFDKLVICTSLTHPW